MPREDKDCVGTYSPSPRRGVPALIRIKKDTTLSEQIGALCHEWAHYTVDPKCTISGNHHGGHTNDFYLQYGRIERGFFNALKGVLKP